MDKKLFNQISHYVKYYLKFCLLSFLFILLLTSFTWKINDRVFLRDLTNPNSNCPKASLSVCWDDPDKSGTNIRSTPGGEIIYKIQPINFPDGCMLTITESNNGWFKLNGFISSPEKEYKIPGGQGWIHKSVISVGTRNYGGQAIKLMDLPNGKTVVAVIKSDVYNLRLNDICGSWVQVIYNGKIGWIQDEWICGNPWTSCS